MQLEVRKGLTMRYRSTLHRADGVVVEPGRRELEHDRDAPAAPHDLART